MKKLAIAIAFGASTMAFSAPAAASVIDYNVADYNAGANCSHGLWTNTSNTGCSRYYSFQDGTTFSVDTNAGTGSFTGTAINDLGEIATLDLSFTDLVDALPNPSVFKAGGGAYDPAVMDFFLGGAGTINIDGAEYTLGGDGLAGDTAVQFGFGANDKDGDFGGSAWLNIIDPNGIHLPHWDINFDLAARPGTPVPAPGGLALLALGLAGVWAGQRRRARAQ